MFPKFFPFTDKVAKNFSQFGFHQKQNLRKGPGYSLFDRHARNTGQGVTKQTRGKERIQDRESRLEETCHCRPLELSVAGEL